ncbi:hypothetical protein [Nocardiopsis sp. MG754419]|uniref:hypothetical protein n=1 Tax=Nocardiopsis sp. MG754419 TaxID=2259865 RepID=UPI001BAAE15E|nr:hypothetical protein [Nocardiopsis sp. MG754419]MBR8743117.1 hypothetical protein [Nocardiopsis sp. MG754419]
MSDVLFRALFDDAALFPPGNAPMGEALSAHRAHRESGRARYVGPFLVSDGRVDELRALLAGTGPAPEPLDLVVTVPGGAADAPAAIAAVGEDRALHLVGLEVAAAPGEAADTAAALDAALPPGAIGYVEVARGTTAAVDIASLVGTGANAKFRTGGVRAEAHPSEDELAALLSAAITAGVPFKCTAGLHHAVRHTSAEGFEQHGFLNVLLATRSLLDGGADTDAAALLADRDGRALAARAVALSDIEQADVRARFRSFGTCDITEPLEDLTVLGVL